MEESYKKIEEIGSRAEEKIGQVSNLKSLEDLRVQFLGRKSELIDILKRLKDLIEEERRKLGPVANELRNKIDNLIEEKKLSLTDLNFKQMIEQEHIDISAPSKKITHGHLHPLTLMREKVEGIFQSIGFELVEGPEVETEYYNFDALNVPADHPAREMQDTFWLQGNRELPNKIQTSKFKLQNPKLLMRTQTSSVQIRYTQHNQPPIRIISTGRVFRMEATDQTHDIQFHQTEGLMIDRDVSLADLKGILEMVIKRLFGDDVKIRFRPSYFPFVEPGVELDMRFRNKWLEIGGAGMVHPKVLSAMGIDSNKWQGFAFGVGLERLTMIKYEIDDVRLFSSGDLRFLKQF